MAIFTDRVLFEIQLDLDEGDYTREGLLENTRQIVSSELTRVPDAVHYMDVTRVTVQRDQHLTVYQWVEVEFPIPEAK